MGTLVLQGITSGSVTLTPAPVAGSTTLTLPSTTGSVIASTGVASSVDTVTTHKVAIVVDGVTYYLLATTSPA
jgi:hypothetical protein